jgi:signal-transduction protein with cAMP-binding, CBS, and nucleotidyltransferase domain
MATIEKHVTRALRALDGTTPCAEAARVMATEHIGSVAVREGGQVVGLVTERDLVTRVLADGAAASLPIRRAMRADLPVVTPATTDAECTALMRDHATRHLLVQEGGAVVGVVSMRDLIQLMLAEKEWLIGQLQNFIDGRDGPRAATG